MKLNGRQMRERLSDQVEYGVAYGLVAFNSARVVHANQKFESNKIEKKNKNKNEIESNTWLHRCEHGRNKSNKIVRLIKTSCGRAGWPFGHKKGAGTGKQYKRLLENQIWQSLESAKLNLNS